MLYSRRVSPPVASLGLLLWDNSNWYTTEWKKKEQKNKLLFGLSSTSVFCFKLHNPNLHKIARSDRIDLNLVYPQTWRIKQFSDDEYRPIYLLVVNKNLKMKSFFFQKSVLFFSGQHGEFVSYIYCISGGYNGGPDRQHTLTRG